MGDIVYKHINGDRYVKIRTLKAFNSWCKRNGWIDAKGFKREMGVSFSKVRNKWIYVYKGIVYIGY